MVVKTSVLSDEDTTFQTMMNKVEFKYIPCNRIIETVDNLDSSTSISHSVYVFNMQNAESVKEILMMCVEKEPSFKVDNITIEIRNNKPMPFYCFCLY